MKAPNYADLMQLARQRHADLKTEMAALESAFPEIGLLAKDGTKRGARKGRAVSDETKRRMSEAAKQRWRQRTNGATADTPGIETPSLATA